MLDDLKYIHQRDAQDALGIAAKQADQLLHAFQAPDFKDQKFNHVVYAGMGGSALAAQLSQTWPGYKVPFEICRSYSLSAAAGPGSLVVASSYSGNTEETLSAVADAEAKGATIAVITGGGQLQEIAEAKGYPLLKLPKAEQPRYATLFNLKALIVVLEAAGLADAANADKALQAAASFLQTSVQAWLPTVPAASNPAKQLAQELMGRSPVVYAGPLMFPAAYKWKISFNENAKNVAWCGQLPEFNHNEFIGWSSHPVDKPYAVIDLVSHLEHPRVQKRFEVSRKLLSGQRPDSHIVEAQGDGLLQQLLWTTAYGDFVSIYLALLNNVNPTPVELVEKFKKELA